MSYFLILCHKIVLTDKSKLVVKMTKVSKVLVWKNERMCVRSRGIVCKREIDRECVKDILQKFSVWEKEFKEKFLDRTVQQKIGRIQCQRIFCWPKLSPKWIDQMCIGWIHGFIKCGKQSKGLSSCPSLH